MGPVAITAQELQAWAAGSMADLGPRDFQDVLTVSRVFVGAVSDFNGKPFPPPWSPELSPEEQAEANAAEERAWDRAMGISSERP